MSAIAALLLAAAAQAPAPSGLQRTSAEIEALAARVAPAVVQVLVSGYVAAGAETGLVAKQTSGGSGVVLDPSGLIVTNAHVVLGARRIQVVLPGPPPGLEGSSVLKARGRRVGAQLVGLDRETDLAVLRVPQAGLPALALGDSEALRQGQLVLALGSPLGLEGSATLGVVSAVARQLEPDSPMIYIQTDAPINPGNSGGPLVDAAGRVVGINTLIFSRSGDSEGIGFAVPANIVRNVFDQIRSGGRVRRGEIGARVQSVTPALAAGLGLPREQGAIVADVTPGGPAEAAGLRIGDLVLGLDGKRIENARQLEVNLYARAPGAAVSIEIQRGDSRATLVATVRERPRDLERLAEMVTPANYVKQLGILALELDLRLAAMLPPLRGSSGLVVAGSEGDATPSQDPLQPGDVIYALNGKPVASLEALRGALGSLRPGDSAVLQVERDAALRYLTFSIE